MKKILLIISVFFSLNGADLQAEEVLKQARDLQSHCKSLHFRPRIFNFINKHHCPRGSRGPTGPQGPVGASAISYASANTNGVPQPLPPPTTTPVFLPIQFLTNQVVPEGIVHPAANNPALFQVINAGVYLITWTMTVLNGAGDNIISIALSDIANQVIFEPFPFQQTIVPLNNFTTLSGQTICHLQAGSQIQLSASRSSTTSDLLVLNPTLTIMQIAP